MFYDLCPGCDGTGERDWLSGALCYDCNGTGWRYESEPWDEGDDDAADEGDRKYDELKDEGKL